MIRVVFAGTPEFSVPCLQALLASPKVSLQAVFTQPDKPQGRGRRIKFSPIKQIAVREQLPCHQPTSLKSPEAQAQIAAYAPDLMIVVAYGLLLPHAVLCIPRYGCWNVHASLLPKYRGASPIQSALLHGDPETGITLMRMDAGLDTGNRLMRQSITIADNDNATTLHHKLSELGAALLITGVTEALVEEGEPQCHAQATHCGKIKKQDAEIDWQLSANVIWRQVRAYHNWPVSFTWLGQRCIRIWQASPCPGSSAAPGTVIGIDDHGLRVACGEGGLRLDVLQLPGGKPLPWREFKQALPMNELLGRQFTVDPSRIEISE